MIEGTYGTVETMTRTYRNHQAAVNAGKRRAKHTGQPAYVGMLLTCKFHISDTDPSIDFRWETYTRCQPDGTTQYMGRR